MLVTYNSYIFYNRFVTLNLVSKKKKEKKDFVPILSKAPKTMTSLS